MRPGTLWITGESEVDDLVNTDPLALLIGMLLDQQIAIELAFRGPSRLKARLGNTLDAATIADWDPARCGDLRREAGTASLPRLDGGAYPRAVSPCRRHLRRRRIADLEAPSSRRHGCREPGGRTRVWRGEGKILLAVLGKRFGVCPPGWEAASAPFSDDQPRSVADMGSAEERLAVRAWKKAQKAAGKAKHE